MEHVGVSRTVHIDPPFKAEGIFLLVTLGPEVIEKSLNVLLHLMAELCDHRLLQIEEIECVVPTTTIRPRDRVAIFLH